MKRPQVFDLLAHVVAALDEERDHRAPRPERSVHRPPSQLHRQSRFPAAALAGDAQTEIGQMNALAKISRARLWLGDLVDLQRQGVIPRRPPVTQLAGEMLVGGLEMFANPRVQDAVSMLEPLAPEYAQHGHE